MLNAARIKLICTKILKNERTIFESIECPARRAMRMGIPNINARIILAAIPAIATLSSSDLW